MGPMPTFAPTSVHRVLVPLAALVLLAACGAPSDSPSPSATPAAPSAEASTAPASTAASPPPSAAPSEPATANDPGALALEVVAEGLASPIGFATAPDGWLLVHERDGRAVALDPASGEQRDVLDITDRVGAGGEQGLLGIALHPEWPEQGTAFVHYTDRGGATVVARYAGEAVDGAPVLDPSSEQVLLTVEQPFANHNGGQLAFGPDGFLYIGLGDGGSGGDPLGNGQNPDVILGKVLRIDVDAASGEAPYGIPADNPFADGGGAPEVFLTGLRNPWRFSFDSSTGLLWIADVGQNAWEEVNRIDPAADAGANLGWNVMEAAHCFADANCSADGLVLPIAEYGHDLGCSVTGGAVYRGEAIPSLRGWYVFSDYCGGILFGVPADAEAPDGGALAPRVLLEPGLSISAFGVDSSGELYVADIEGGRVYRIVGG